MRSMPRTWPSMVLRRLSVSAFSICSSSSTGPWLPPRLTPGRPRALRSAGTPPRGDGVTRHPTSSVGDRSSLENDTTLGEFLYGAEAQDRVWAKPASPYWRGGLRSSGGPSGRTSLGCAVAPRGCGKTRLLPHPLPPLRGLRGQRSSGTWRRGGRRSLGGRGSKAPPTPQKYPPFPLHESLGREPTQVQGEGA